MQSLPKHSEGHAANRLTQVDGAPLLWDDAGNLLQDQDGARYTYDVTGRMVQVEQAGTTYRYRYNGRGGLWSQLLAAKSERHGFVFSKSALPNKRCSRHLNK